MQIQLGEKKIEVAPMTWGTQKKVFKTIIKALATLAESKDMLKKMVFAAAAGAESIPTAPLADLVNDFPELLSEVLVVGIPVSAEDLDNATGIQVLEALKVFVEENALSEQMERAKKAFSLLAPASQQVAPSVTGK